MIPPNPPLVGFDTNVALRLLLKDDPGHAACFEAHRAVVRAGAEPVCAAQTARELYRIATGERNGLDFESDFALLEDMASRCDLLVPTDATEGL